MDAFEQGRKKAREEQDEIKKGYEKRKKISEDTARRLYSLIGPKMTAGGYTVWIENNDLYVARKKVDCPGSNAALHFTVCSQDNKLIDVWAPESGGWHIRNGHQTRLTDEQAVMVAGEFFEIDSKRWEANRKHLWNVFWRENWGWFVVPIIILILWINL